MRRRLGGVPTALGLSLCVAGFAQIPVDLAARGLLRLRPSFSARARLGWLAIASSGVLMAIGYRGIGGRGQFGIWGPLLVTIPAGERQACTALRASSTVETCGHTMP